MKNPKDIAVSNQTKEKATSAKLYIERRYTKLIQDEMEKKLNWEKLYKKMEQLSLPEEKKELIKETILHKQSEGLREARKKESIADFDFVKVIGKGAFGEVRLYNWKKNNQPVAIKRMIKSEMIFKNKMLQAQVQQSIMAKFSMMSLSKHVVKLLSSFQDQKYLYLVMEYLGGGDMMNLLIKKDIFTQHEAKIYIAELVVALQCVHKLKYIHRDIKPDNILIDSSGHIKLSDFGLCKHTQIQTNNAKSLIDNLKLDNKPKDRANVGTLHKRKLAYSTVGTPDYVAPQVQSKNGYTQTVDWWSLGVILFQMLVGYPPFCGQTSQKTWQNIQNWRKVFHIPKDKQLSVSATDLIKKLVNDQKVRLGTNGVQQIKSHPFFAEINWKTLKQSIAPNIPQLQNHYDTNNFDEFEDGQIWVQQKLIDQKSKRTNHFAGYTFKQNPKQNSQLLKALVDLDTLLPSKTKTPSRDHSLKQSKPLKSISKQVQKPLSKKSIPKVVLTSSKTLTLNTNNIKRKLIVSKTKSSAEKKKPQLNKSENQKKRT